MPEHNSRASEKLRGSILVAKNDGDHEQHPTNLL
jgi:hypothetical protein